MSGSGSTPTKPVPAPRRGSKPNEQHFGWIVEFQNTVRQLLKGWMDKLEKCVYCAYQKSRNVTKVGRPTGKRAFRCPRGKRIFLSSTRVCSPWGTKVRNCATMLSQIREELNPPTDNEQLLRLKRMSKSPHFNPLLRDLAMYITVRKLNILLKMLTSWAQCDKKME